MQQGYLYVVSGDGGGIGKDAARLPVCSLWGWRGDRQRCSKATCM